MAIGIQTWRNEIERSTLFPFNDHAVDVIRYTLAKSGLFETASAPLTSATMNYVTAHATFHLLGFSVISELKGITFAPARSGNRSLQFSTLLRDVVEAQCSLISSCQLFKLYVKTISPLSKDSRVP